MAILIFLVKKLKFVFGPDLFLNPIYGKRLYTFGKPRVCDTLCINMDRLGWIFISVLLVSPQVVGLRELMRELWPTYKNI